MLILDVDLAIHLAASGIQCGMIIPLLFEKSVWTVVAMLAIMWTGAAFVLLDASLPEERLKAISRQANSSVILSSKEKEDLGKRIVPRVFVVDVFSLKSLCDSASDPAEFRSSDPFRPMYVAYTSGSTVRCSARFIHFDCRGSVYSQRCPQALRYNFGLVIGNLHIITGNTERCYSHSQQPCVGVGSSTKTFETHKQIPGIRLLFLQLRCFNLQHFRDT